MRTYWTATTPGRWWDVRSYKDELEQVRSIQATSAREILAELIRIFGAVSDSTEIEADLSLVDYLEGRKKFWEDIKPNGLDGMDTIRALRQELEAVKRELKALKRARARDKLKQILKKIWRKRSMS